MLVCEPPALVQPAQVSGDTCGSQISLEPLRSLGPDALNVWDLPEFRKITLLRITVAAEDSSNRLLTVTADDLFSCAPAGCPPPNLIPAIGTIIKAVFKIDLLDFPHPAIVKIAIPNCIKAPDWLDFSRLERWLVKSGLRLGQKICQLLLVVGLALATAFSSVDGDDDDDDDADSHRLVAHLAHSHRPGPSRRSRARDCEISTLSA